MKDFLYEFEFHNRTPLISGHSYSFSVYNNDENKYHIGGNISIYNRNELLSDLKLTNNELSDDVLLLKHWLNFGNNTFNRIYGEFIFFVHDISKNELLAVKDPTSPLKIYYYNNSNKFIVSDNLKAILRLLQKIELNENKLIEDIANIGFLSKEKYYKNIFFLRKGEFIRKKGKNEKKISRYYNIPCKPIMYKNEKDYFEHFDELLNQSILNRIKKPEKVGLMLSGGIDSTTIAYKLATLFPNNKISTYTHAPKYKVDHNFRLTDESELVKTMLYKFKNLNGKILRSEYISVIDAITECLKIHPEPLHGVNNAYWILDIVNSLIKDKKKSLINGNAGNATISWPTYMYYKRYYNKSLTIKKCIKKALLHLNTFDKYFWKKEYKNSLFDITNYPRYNVYSKNKILKLIDNIDFDFFSKENFRETLLFSEYINPLLSLTEIKVIDPLSDIKLAEYLYNIPSKYFTSWHNRFILNYLKNKVPNSILENQKIGLQSSDILFRLEEEKAVAKEITEKLKKSYLVNKYFDQKELDFDKTFLKDVQKMLFLYKLENNNLL